MKVNSSFKDGLISKQNQIKKNMDDNLKKNIIFTNNLAPTINIQLPMFNA